MKVSVLCPTRGRVTLLQTMLTTLFATASNRSNVEVIARVDSDDEQTISYLWAQEVKMVIGPRVGYAFNAQMVNECAAASFGDLLLVANDDLEFQTQDWDLKLGAVAKRYPDGIFDLGVDTLLNNENYCFPCTSRRAVDLFGFFFDDRLLYPDIWMRDVMMPFGRAIRVPEVVIAHRWQGMSDDQRGAVYASATVKYNALYEQCVNEGRAKVATVLERMTV